MELIKNEDVIEGQYYWVKSWKKSEEFEPAKCRLRGQKNDIPYFCFTNGSVQEVACAYQIIKLEKPEVK